MTGRAGGYIQADFTISVKGELVPLLQVEDLRVSFRTADGTVQAVRGISYDVEAGQTLGIVGESGSGKSVSTQTIMGLTRGAQISGRAVFEGKDLLTASRATCSGFAAPRSA